MSSRVYEVVQTVPTMILDKTGRPVNGYNVYIWLPEFGETIILETQTLDPSEIDKKARMVLGNRRKLSELGIEE